MPTINPLYLDTSAAIKLFLPDEKGSFELKNFIESKSPYSLLSSSLIKVEMYSIVRRISRTQSVSFDIDYLKEVISELLSYIVIKPITDKVIDDSIQ
ncbi:MAG: hypothetical protein KDK90_24375 [Leptospiraceae bacterium]|nr:hypothetical protein [Leptospiraceae bacterium]